MLVKCEKWKVYSRVFCGMDLKLEQRVCVKFCFKSGYTATDICKTITKSIWLLMSVAYNDFQMVRSVSQRMCDRWWSKREITHLLNNWKHKAVCTVLVQDHHCTIRVLAERFHIDKETMHMIITANLAKKGVCTFHSALVDSRTPRGAHGFFWRS